MPGGEAPEESEPWRVYTGSATQLYGFEGALTGRLDGEGNVMFGEEEPAPAERRPAAFMRPFVHWIWDLVGGRPVRGIACPHLDLGPQTDGACDGPGENLSEGNPLGGASVILVGEDAVGDDEGESGESESSTGSESRASVDTEITVPEDEGPGLPWEGVEMGMQLARAQTAPGGLVESVGSGSGAGEGEGELGGLSGLGGGSLSRVMSV